MYSSPSASPASYTGTTFGCSSDAASCEPRAERFVLRELGREELQRDIAFQPAVVCQVHDAHAAASQHALDVVARELLADPIADDRHSGSVDRKSTRLNSSH